MKITNKPALFLDANNGRIRSILNNDEIDNESLSWDLIDSSFTDDDVFQFVKRLLFMLSAQAAVHLSGEFPHKYYDLINCLGNPIIMKGEFKCKS